MIRDESYDREAAGGPDTSNASTINLETEIMRHETHVGRRWPIQDEQWTTLGKMFLDRLLPYSPEQTGPDCHRPIGWTPKAKGMSGVYVDLWSREQGDHTPTACPLVSNFVLKDLSF